MESLKRITRNYWLAYYFVYVGGVAIGLWRYWQRLSADDGILWLAAIFGASAGFALLVAIILEAIGRMVLLIPATIKKLKEEGRQEGRREGLQEGRREGLQEGRREGRRDVLMLLAQSGAREDGSIQITLTPETVKALLEEL